MEVPPMRRFPWPTIAWFGALLLAGYVPVLKAFLSVWSSDEMGHGYFVPLIAGYIVWQYRHELMSLEARPNWWGLAVVLYAAVQLFIGTLGAEGFLSQSSFVIALYGMVLLLGGTAITKKLAFPLFLLFFMVPIPTILYNRITFPLQILGSQLAANTLTLIGIPVLREGNILELPSQRLSVVEACSGIRSLLSLTFLSLVYGHFFEKRTWLRAVLFLATIPIAILANSGRITLTGILSQIKPELAEGFFHESTGWVIFMMAFAILIGFHHVARRTAVFIAQRRYT
jgi:exosortase